jgi:hypothetical protein
VKDAFESAKLSFDIGGTNLRLFAHLNDNVLSGDEDPNIIAEGTYSYNISKDDVDDDGCFYVKFITKDNVSQFTFSNVCLVHDIKIEDFAVVRSAVRNAYTAYILELVAAQEEDARRKGEIA